MAPKTTHGQTYDTTDKMKVREECERILRAISKAKKGDADIKEVRK